MDQIARAEVTQQLVAGTASEIDTVAELIRDDLKFLQVSLRDVLCVVEPAALLGENTDFCDWQRRSAEARRTAHALNFESLRVEVPRALQQMVERMARLATAARAMKRFMCASDEPCPINLNQAIQDVITVGRPAWKEVAEVQMDLDQELPLVTCVPGDIYHALLVLLLNATEAVKQVAGGGSKGQINIATHYIDGEDEVRITHTGRGSPPGMSAQRVQPRTECVGEIAAKHGGRVIAAADADTSMILRLPLAPAASVDAQRKRAHEPPCP